jgi:hypothetical protein
VRHFLVAALLPIVATAQAPCRTPVGVPCHTIRFQQTQWSLFRSGVSDVQRFRMDRLSAVRRDGSSIAIINSDQFTLTGGRRIGATQVSMYLAPTDQMVVINHDEKAIRIQEPGIGHRPYRLSADGDTGCTAGIGHFGTHYQQAGQDTVAGIPVTKWIAGDDQLYLAPSLDCLPLKITRIRRNAWHLPIFIDSMEALSVEFGEPRPELFLLPKGYRTVDSKYVLLGK